MSEDVTIPRSAARAYADLLRADKMDPLHRERLAAALDPQPPSLRDEITEVMGRLTCEHGMWCPGPDCCCADRHGVPNADAVLAVIKARVSSALSNAELEPVPEKYRVRPDPVWCGFAAAADPIRDLFGIKS